MSGTVAISKPDTELLSRFSALESRNHGPATSTAV